MPTSRRQHLKQLTAAALIVPGGISGLIRLALANGNAPIAAGMHSVSGDVRVNNQPAHAGMLIKSGDSLYTGPNAQAIYVIGQDAFLQRDNSIIRFSDDSAQKVMRVVTGKILSVFGKGERKILVSTATIGIRGTGCYIEDSPAKVSPRGTAPATPDTSNNPDKQAPSSTYFCLCYGEAELIPTASPQERVVIQTTHHDHPLTVHDDMSMPTRMATASVVNHTDAELTLLEALVGRRPPFSGSERY